ncbi:MAG: SDR family oxidoreductase [Promethearchaeota archaeon]
MKILITGARGFLANSLIPILLKEHDLLLTSLHSDKPISRETIFPLDLADFNLTNEYIQSNKPDIIINTAAISLPDWAENHKERTYATNVTAVENLTKICTTNPDIKLIQISTDYVFSGENAPYSEYDEPNPINYYGYTKYMAEKVILEEFSRRKLENYLICRTTLLYGLKKPHHRGNFFINFYESLVQNKKVKASISNITCPTFVDDLSFCLKFLIEKNLSGIIHTSGPESVSRFEFAKKIAKIFELDRSNIIPTKIHTKNAKRPNNSTLNTSKLKNILPFKMKNIEEALLEIKKKITSII